MTLKRLSQLQFLETAHLLPHVAHNKPLITIPRLTTLLFFLPSPIEPHPVSFRAFLLIFFFFIFILFLFITFLDNENSLL